MAARSLLVPDLYNFIISQAKAVHDFALEMGWRSVSVLTIYGEDYGKSLRAGLKKYSREKGRLTICENYKDVYSV